MSRYAHKNAYNLIDYHAVIKNGHKDYVAKGKY